MALADALLPDNFEERGQLRDEPSGGGEESGRDGSEEGLDALTEIFHRKGISYSRGRNRSAYVAREHGSSLQWSYGQAWCLFSHVLFSRISITVTINVTSR